MIFIYGDSHANTNFKNLNLPFVNKFEKSITMFRIGRDNIIINFNNQEHNEDSILCFNYGEVDCRCHIQRQINLGKNENDIIYELVDKYFNTINNNINKYSKIIIVAIIPPTKQMAYESLYGQITHEFPFVGSDEERVSYTIKMNNLLKEYCNKYNFIYFDPFDYYKSYNGLLNFELSDNNIHLGDNSFFLEKFIEL